MKYRLKESPHASRAVSTSALFIVPHVHDSLEANKNMVWSLESRASEDIGLARCHFGNLLNIDENK